MADYYLKDSATPTKMYRLSYEGTGPYSINGAYVTGLDVTLPSGQIVSGIDVGVDMREIIVELVLGTMTVGTRAQYRILAKTVIDSQWA